MPTIRRGLNPPYTAIYRGAVPMKEVRQGNTLVWSRAAIYDCFDFDGFIDHWIDELCSDPGNLISNAYGLLIDGLDNTYGQIVQYVQDGVNQAGTLVATGADAAVDAYCGLWGGTAPDGLVGLVNGIPLIGPTLADILKDWFGGNIDITSLVGKIPVIGQIAQSIGILPDSLGNLVDPINYVIDEAGTVLGIISCGQFKDLGGIFEPICFAIGAVGGAAKLIIPDGLMSLNLTTGQFRYPTQVAADDGYLEVEVAEGGGAGVITQVFRRYSNSGGANGVGIDLRDSAASIVRRVANVSTLVKPNLGSFIAGDRLRLVQAGNTHSLFRNGLPMGAPWVDALNSAASGAANRSVAMLMQAAQPLGGARIFSPALSCIEAA